MKPIVYLLCGLPFSGKTTYAKSLEERGVVRFTLDEEIYKKFGTGFDPSKYLEIENEIKEAMLLKIPAFIKENKSVALDWGFWKRSERDNLKELIEKAGGLWQLVYFKVPLFELQNRMKQRDLKESQRVTPEMLDQFSAEFENPKGEGEVVITA